MRNDQTVTDCGGNELEVGTRASYWTSDKPGRNIVTVTAITDYDVDYSDATERAELYPPQVAFVFDDGTKDSVSTHDATSVTWDDYPDGPELMVFQADDLDSSLEATDPLRIVRTPIRHRLIVWPGSWFGAKPFPYLFHRYDVVSAQGWFGGFTRRRSAEQWIKDASEPTDVRAKRIVDEHGSELRKMLGGQP